MKKIFQEQSYRSQLMSVRVAFYVDGSFVQAQKPQGNSQIYDLGKSIERLTWTSFSILDFFKKS